jgi:hypothetical protein
VSEVIFNVVKRVHFIWRHILKDTLRQASLSCGDRLHAALASAVREVSFKALILLRFWRALPNSFCRVRITGVLALSTVHLFLV